TCLLPFRQVRQARKRGIGGFAHLVEAQPLGQRIDRFDQRQLREIRLRDDAVGMHHLPHTVVECDRARYVAPFSDRQQLLQVILARIEISQREIAGLIAGVDLIGRAWPVWRRGGGGGGGGGGGVAGGGPGGPGGGGRYGAPGRAAWPAPAGRSPRWAGETGDR